MNSGGVFNQLGNFLLYGALQVTASHVWEPSSSSACFIYVAFLLLLPYQQTNLATLLFIAFFTGILVDLWYNSMGIHAFASVLIMYIRSLLLSFVLPNTARYDAPIQPSLTNLGWALFPFFAFVLIVIHHTAIFLLDTMNPWLVLLAIRKISSSTFLTYAAVLTTQILIHLVSRR